MKKGARMRKVFAMFLAVVLLLPCVNVMACDYCLQFGKIQIVDINGESQWTLVNVDDGDTIIYGDVNGDGKINNRDLALLQQYQAGWDVTVAPGADADGDGKVSNRDIAIMQQYLAGWDVVLGAKANKDPIIYNQRYAAIDKETSGEISLVFTKEGQVWAYSPSPYDWENDDDDCVLMAHKTYECKDGYIYIDGSTEPEIKISDDKQELFDADESLNRPGFKCTGEEVITDATFKEGLEYYAVCRDGDRSFELTVTFSNEGLDLAIKHWNEDDLITVTHVPYMIWDIVNKQHFSFEFDGHTTTFVLTDGGNTLYIPEYMCVATLVEK